MTAVVTENGLSSSAHEHPMVPTMATDIQKSIRADSEVPTKNTRVPFVNLFKNNRMANADYKLEYMDTGVGELNIELEEVDYVEKTYGICLLGFVLSGKPPTAALIDLVRRWGTGIRFQTHDSCWIVFKFPDVAAKERVLGGGPYMVYGFHLFLKEMPRCFRFCEADMKSFPSWVQIHGLPPDCWNFSILSKLASRLGNPIHMDMLTHDRKRMKYARVLIEIEASKPKLTELTVALPFGKVVVKFEYEQDFQFCGNCRKAGHLTASCPASEETRILADGNNIDVGPSNRNRSRSVVWRKRYSRGRSRVAVSYKHAPPRTSSTAMDPNNTAQGDVLNKNDNVHATDTTNIVHTNVTCPPLNSNDIIGDNQVHVEVPTKVDKGKKPMYPQPTAVVEEVVDKLETDDFEVVSNKKKNKKQKKKKGKNDEGQPNELPKNRNTFYDGMEESSSCDTEFVFGC